jgi:IS1 family transposase
MLFQKPFRIPVGTWYHLIETTLPSGYSKVLATICNRRSVEQIQVLLQKHKKSPSLIYTIDPTPIYEQNRRCCICNCPK